MSKDLKKIYSQINQDNFPSKMKISFMDDDNKEESSLFYEKVTWNIEGKKQGLRYGENPDQKSALYKLINKQIKDDFVRLPNSYLASNIELIQSGKHPSKTNITDIDNCLNILKFFSDKAACVIVKHNNPCGVAKADTLESAYRKAYNADSIAAFGGCIALNMPLDKSTAEAISKQFADVVLAPEFEEGSLDILSKKKNLRIVKINNINNLSQFINKNFIEFKSLIDGGIIAQESFVPKALNKEDLIVAETEYKSQIYKIERKPNQEEYEDMIFGWLVESGISSNSVIYVKDQCTLAIAAGEQDRLGVAQLATSKAYKKLANFHALQEFKVAYENLKDEEKKEIDKKVEEEKGGLINSTMISDGFFPFEDAICVGLKEGVKAVVQPGGSINDYQSILACNKFGATMVFTGQRAFKH